MKKTKLFLAIFTALFLSAFVTNVSFASGKNEAGDKWEIKSIKGPSTCHLGGQDFGFKIQIKNAGNTKSSGDKITIKVYVNFNGQRLGGNDFELSPGKIAAGKTTILKALCTNENFKNVTGTSGSKTISVSCEIIGAGNSKLIEEVDIRVK